MMSLGAANEIAPVGTLNPQGKPVTALTDFVFGQQFTHTADRKAMTSPPTVTRDVVANIATYIASAFLWQPNQPTGAVMPANAAFFSYFGVGRPVTVGLVTFPDYFYVRWTSTTSDPAGYTGITRVAFNFQGQKLAFRFKGVTGFQLIKVNDEFVTLTPYTVANNGAENICVLDFGSAVSRRIEFMTSNLYFGGVYTASSDTISPALCRGDRLCVVSDSFGAGTGSDSNLQPFPTVMGERLGFDYIMSSSIGGTGYLSGVVDTYTRLDADVIANKPDEVWFALGYNDYNFYSAAAIQSAAQKCFTKILLALPKVRLRVVGPWWRNGAASQPVALLAARDAIRSAALACNVPFIDVLEKPLSASTPAITSTLGASVNAGVTSLSSTSPLVVGTVMKFPDGTKFQVKAQSGSGPYTITTDSAIQTAQVAGAALTQIGMPIWSGDGGKVGTPTGYGNCDSLVSADGVHPSPAGHLVLGREIPELYAGTFTTF